MGDQLSFLACIRGLFRCVFATCCKHTSETCASHTTGVCLLQMQGKVSSATVVLHSARTIAAKQSRAEGAAATIFLS